MNRKIDQANHGGSELLACCNQRCQLLDATSWKPGLGQLVRWRGLHQQRLADSILCCSVMHAYVLE